MTNYTGKYTKIDSGYMGQLVKWPEVVLPMARIWRSVVQCYAMH